MFCFVDYRISDTELKNLENLNLTPIKIPKCKNLYLAIDGHVDIQMTVIDRASKLILLQKDISTDFLNHMKALGINFILSKNSLESSYPKNVILNALITDEFLLHNLKVTDTNLLNAFPNLEKLNIKQGYSNCSILKVSNKAFVTSDIKASTLLKSKGYDVLLVPPGDIVLEGLDYGFIGGVGGLISKNKLAFFGSLDNYKYGPDVKNFLSKHKISYIYLNEGPLVDRGSLFIL